MWNGAGAGIWLHYPDAGMIGRGQTVYGVRCRVLCSLAPRAVRPDAWGSVYWGRGAGRGGRCIGGNKQATCVVDDEHTGTACPPLRAEDYHQQYLSKGGRFGSAQSAAKGCTDTIRCYGKCQL